MHHRDPVADLLDQRQVVGDEQVGQAQLAAQPLEQVQHLRLDQHVERGHRLVADHEGRVAARSPGRWPPAGTARRTARAAGACAYTDGSRPDQVEQLVDPRCGAARRCSRRSPSSGSSTSSATRQRGFSEPNGSWYTICIVPARLRECRRRSRTRSVPWNSHLAATSAAAPGSPTGPGSTCPSRSRPRRRASPRGRRRTTRPDTACTTPPVHASGAAHRELLHEVAGAQQRLTRRPCGRSRWRHDSRSTAVAGSGRVVARVPAAPTSGRSARAGGASGGQCPARAAAAGVGTCAGVAARPERAARRQRATVRRLARRSPAAASAAPAPARDRARAAPGCRASGRARTASPAGACSTARPAYMTTTSSA